MDFLAIELAGIGLPWAQSAHGDRCGGSTGWTPDVCGRLVGGAAALAGVFLFPVYLSHAASKCCVLASKMRRKHRFGAETVSPEGARQPILLRSGLVFSAFFAF